MKLSTINNALRKVGILLVVKTDDKKGNTEFYFQRAIKFFEKIEKDTGSVAHRKPTLKEWLLSWVKNYPKDCSFCYHFEECKLRNPGTKTDCPYFSER